VIVAAGCASAADPPVATGPQLGGTTVHEETSSTTDPDDDDESSSSASGAVEESSSGAPMGTETDPTGMSTTEICDGIDNDLDGLVDEYSLMNTLCGGCILLPLAGFAYWVCETPMAWAQARMECEARGAELASVHSDMENQLIVGAPAVGTSIWIGGNDLLVEGTFEWADGSDWGYENWADTEPNDVNGDEDCALVLPGGEWNDDPCTGALVFACKAPHV
jgi:hypothetical protein